MMRTLTSLTDYAAALLESSGQVMTSSTIARVLTELARFEIAAADLSGGQQQQLAIARALAPRPKLLILDEPTEGVQPSIVEDIEAAIAALKGRMAIPLVEQYSDFACSLADAYVVLDRGRVALRGAGRNMEADGVSRFLSV